MRLLIYDQILLNRKHKHSLVLIDPHGDLSMQFKRSKLLLNDKNFIYFEPELIKGHSPITNPFELPYKDRRNIEVHTQHLALALEETIRTERSVNMGALLVPSFYLLLGMSYSDFSDLLRLMKDDQELIERGKQLPIRSHRIMFENFHDPLYLKTKASIYTKIQSLLNYSAFSNATLGHSTIDIRKNINTGKTMLFNISERYF